MSLTPQELYRTYLASEEKNFNKRFADDECPRAQYGDFKLLRTIRATARVKVFRAQHLITREECTLRVLRKIYFNETEQKNTLSREKKIQYAARSPFIDKLLYAFQDNSSVYFVSEYPLYGTLERIFDLYDKVPENLSKLIAAQIILGLEYLQACKIIYRNLKPANILLFHDGYLKLTNFKLASKLTGWVPSAFGTIPYMAPEQFATDSIDHNVDWWSFGVILYDLLLGDIPFAPDKGKRSTDLIRKIKRADIKLDANQKKIIHPDAEDLIRNLLKKDFARRLGALGDGAAAVKGHAWFREIDFLSLYEKRILMKWDLKPQNFDTFVSADNSLASARDSHGGHFSDF
ncbi:cAMP-dependent protein kinase catalytic subunit beta-like [Galendromus occidentalis]|uniref:cAMP-dependent protein kinase catalytic subunit beta-like n=1 Tax=Galendromus occidentalis TaxID=34638 RepID=A0AAJ6QW72_9ACAR|nr:cAMP-dependent protein kinase catalytic subunit beta-like [Galendromus occidentalis]